MDKTPIISQISIQKKGGICARIPSACMIRKLLSEAGIDISIIRVFDITYGEGRFWAASRPRLLIGADIAILEWIIEPDVFIKKPAWQSWRVLANLDIRVDLVAVDPPWVERGNSKRRHFGLDRALGSPRLILEAAETAARELGAKYLLVHYKNYWIPEGWSIVVHYFWQPMTRYMSAGPTWWAILTRR